MRPPIQQAQTLFAPSARGRVELSYLAQAPDHGLPELAVVLPGRRYVVVAVGQRAEALLAQLDGDKLLALAEAEVAG